jgi:hypothetical protein
MEKLVQTLIAVFVMALLPFTVIAQNQIWIVNNNPGGAGDFSDLSEAQDVAVDGDTLYLVPSTTTYFSGINKQLHIYGGGYLHSENNIVTHNTGESTIRITSISGVQNSASNTADGSSLNGLTVQSNSSSGLYVVADDITFRRCNIETEIVTNDNEPFSGLTIIQSLVQWVEGPSQFGIHYRDVYIANSYIKTRVSNITDGTIINSVIEGTIGNLNNVTFENNVFLSTSTDPVFDSDNNNTVSHNIFAQAEPSNPGTNNLFSVDTSTLFIGPDDNSTDAQWQLSDSSPAKGAGTNGDDIGMFGGPNPYVLSGIPAIPRVTEFTAPSAGSDNSGLPVSIKIQSEN